MRFGGERRYALAVEPAADARGPESLRVAQESCVRAQEDGAVLAYGFVDARDAAPCSNARLRVARPGAAARASASPVGLRAALGLKLPPAAQGLLAKVPLVAPFGRSRRTGFREIAVKEPRITRLWDRFSIDVGVAVERTASYFERRVFDRLGRRLPRLHLRGRRPLRDTCNVHLQGEGRAGRSHRVRHGAAARSQRDRPARRIPPARARAARDDGRRRGRRSRVVASALGELPDLRAPRVRVAARRASALGTNDVRVGVRAFDSEVDDLVTLRERWYLSYLDLDSL